MKIEWVNDQRAELSRTLEVPDGYRLPSGTSMAESDWHDEVPGYRLDLKRIQIDGACVNFYRKSYEAELSSRVRTDAPYLQMHFEMAGGATYYKPHHKKGLALPTEPGEFTLFFVPELDGTLSHPACRDALSIEIEISEDWLRANLRENGPRVAQEFAKAIQARQPAMLGKGSHAITPDMHQILYQLQNCPYAGDIKRLFVEGKLLELLGIQLHYADLKQLRAAQVALSKGDIDRIYGLREHLSKDFSVHHTIQQMASNCFMNRTKMQAGFKQLFGVTIHDFILGCRMNEAYRLLTDTEKFHPSVTEVAKYVGYRHYNHFSAAFKKHFGVSPRKVQHCLFDP